MKLEVIDTLDTFLKIKDDWNEVYDADEQAQFFLSWIWLLSTLQQYDQDQDPWFILAMKSEGSPKIRSDSDYVAFFPLKIGINEKESGTLYTELTVAGMTDACHGTFICRLDYEQDAISVFVDYLTQYQAWSVLTIANVSTVNSRLQRLLDQFSEEDFIAQDYYHTNDVDSIDNNIVPCIVLPCDWDSYTQNLLSANTRQKINRFLRKVENSSELRITRAASDTLEDDLQVLFELWQQSWEGRKGKHICQNIIKHAGVNLRSCFKYGCLDLSILWQGQMPLGAIANLVDQAKKSVLFFMGGRNESVKKISPGLILHSVAIRSAIQQGFKYYDFLMGNEAYKFSFGAQERHIKIVSLHRQREPDSFSSLDRRVLHQALEIASIYHRANYLGEAEKVYQQILQVKPDHSDALCGLGVIHQRTGAYQIAEKLLKQLLTSDPSHVKAWFSLGTLYQTQSQLDAAAHAYRQALTLPADNSTQAATYHNLGYILQQQENWEAAIDCYQQARNLQPDCLEAEVIWANARYTQRQLTPDQQSEYAFANLDLGDQRRIAGDFGVAIAYYQQAILMNPDLAEAHYYLGWTLQAQGEVSDSDIMASYQEALRLQPSYAEADVAIAMIRYCNHTLAVHEYADYAAANYALGRKYEKIDDWNMAISYYRQAVQLKPDLTEAYCHLGNVLQWKDQTHWDEAIACYQKAQSLQPNDLAALVGLANIRHSRGELSPENQVKYADMNYTLGEIQQQESDLKAAIKSYRQAITLNAKNEFREALRQALQEESDVTIKVSHAKQSQ